ncbi:hypothetical protein Cgig2_027754 [Carnegiea gigantea]|uniref:Uncharacterized protein n=1 Tax=Carnegiea gigantea TaxID=171969 RepID=A0A9Q1JWS8_9CARY|nr:hypothetical protein Cgig2_027754 [Carnegiea gigantea]
MAWMAFSALIALICPLCSRGLLLLDLFTMAATVKAALVLVLIMEKFEFHMKYEMAVVKFLDGNIIVYSRSQMTHFSPGCSRYRFSASGSSPSGRRSTPKHPMESSPLIYRAIVRKLRCPPPVRQNSPEYAQRIDLALTAMKMVFSVQKSSDFLESQNSQTESVWMEINPTQ